MVLVDVDNMLDDNVKFELIDLANVNIPVFTQKISNLDKFLELKSNNPNRFSLNCLPVLGKYDINSKYSKKNVIRYIKEKRGIGVIPYNTLFFESAEESGVVDMFLKLRNIKDINDSNYIFMYEIKEIIEIIMNRIQEMQMRMR